MSEKTRENVIIHHNLFIPPRARCCRSHPDNIDQYAQLQAHRDISLEESQYINRILIQLRVGQMTLKVPELIASNDEYFKFWTKLSTESFRDLITCLPSLSDKKKEEKLFIFLLKLRHNCTDGEIAKLFQISDSTVRRWNASTTQSFKNDLLDRDLGSREFGCSQSSVIANETLLGDRNNPDQRLIIIADGGYIYHQASSNFAYQARSFSVQKTRHLVKPMLIVYPNGYILDLHTTNAAVNNDADIFSHILRTDTQFRQHFRRNDVLLVDRGFRNVVRASRNFRFEVRIPPSASGRAQLTWQQANEARQCTLNRWPVEVVFAHLKDSKMISDIWYNKSLPSKYSDYISIRAKLVNLYNQRLYSNRGNENRILERYHLRRHYPNLLHPLAVENHFNTRLPHFRVYDPFNENLFPRLTSDDLYIYCTGTYVLRLAPSYIKYMRNENISMHPKVCLELNRFIPQRYGLNVTEPRLFQLRFSSRYQSNKTYRCFILLDSILEGIDSIVQHYCSCLSGARTLGCCAHGAAALWYFSEGYADDSPEPGAHLREFAVRMEHQQLFPDPDT